MQYFLTKLGNTKEGVITDKNLLNQIGVVLRGRVGDRFCFIDGNGRRDLIELTGFLKKEIKYKVIETLEFKDNSKKLRLYLALPKLKSKWEFILQKGTELGVTEFVPLKSEFCQGKYPIGTERDHLLIKEATEQSERLFLPKILDVVNFNDIILDDDFYLFDSFNKTLPLQFDIQDEFLKKEVINLVIGPEGGFSQKEISLAGKNKKCKFLSLGKNVLRLETACIVALSRINLT